MTIRYKVKYAVVKCPYCGSEIMSGHRRFGPKQVQCYKCEKVMETDLTPWAELPTGRKWRMALTELIVPSWDIPVKAFIQNLFACSWVAGMIGLLGGGLLTVAIIYATGNVNLFSNTVVNVSLVIILGIMGFLLVPVRRLIRIVRESNQYSKTDIPPVWRKAQLMRKNGQ